MRLRLCLCGAGAAVAQDETVYGGCVDARGAAVPTFADAQLPQAVATGIEAGRAVIRHNPDRLPRLLPLLDKQMPGFGELFRTLSYGKIGSATIQSRAVAGVAGGTYLFALPGSPGAVRDAWDGILKFQLDNRHRPCNLVELMPRLTEHLKTTGA